MAQTFTGPAPRSFFTRPDEYRGDDYTLPVAAVRNTAGRPQPSGYVQPWQQPIRPTAPVYAAPVPPTAPVGYIGANPGFAAQPWGIMPANRAGRRRGLAWVAGGEAAALAITAAVVVGVAAGQGEVHNATPSVASAPNTQSPAASPAPPPPALIDDTDLPRMVPPADHVADVVDARALTPMDKVNGPGLLNDYSDPAGCIGTVVPGAKSAYSGAGVRATYVQALHDPDRSVLHLVINSVSTFDSAPQAKAFVSTQVVAWQGCPATPITLDADQEHPSSWVVRDIAQRGDMLTARTQLRDGGNSCQRALVAKLNVVDDISVCTDMPSNAAATLATETVGRLGQPT